MNSFDFVLCTLFDRKKNNCRCCCW